MKSRSIAKDLFGTSQNYVIPVDEINSETRLTDAFQWLMQNEITIKNILEQKMTDYIDQAKQVKQLEKLIYGFN